MVLDQFAKAAIDINEMAARLQYLGRLGKVAAQGGRAADDPREAKPTPLRT